MKKFRLTAEAASDLTEIFDYIAQDSIDTALSVTARIYDEIKKIAKSPAIGHRRQDLTNRNLLFWPIYSYLVIYQPTSPVNIIAVLRGTRDVARLLKTR